MSDTLTLELPPRMRAELVRIVERHAKCCAAGVRTVEELALAMIWEAVAADHMENSSSVTTAATLWDSER